MYGFIHYTITFIVFVVADSKAKKEKSESGDF